MTEECEHLLKAIERSLESRESFWEKTERDPHGIAMAVMVALAEVRWAINEVRDPDGEKDLPPVPEETSQVPNPPMNETKE